MPTVTVTMHGPMLDGRAPGIIREHCDDMGRDLAELGNVLVRANLNTSLRTQTPYYRTRITAQKEAPGQYLVTDQGVVYGPWLEGTGSRNRTTRFKGYFTFRRTCQELNARAVSAVEPIVRRLVARLNGA